MSECLSSTPRSSPNSSVLPSSFLGDSGNGPRDCHPHGGHPASPTLLNPTWLSAGPAASGEGVDQHISSLSSSKNNNKGTTEFQRTSVHTNNKFQKDQILSLLTYKCLKLKNKECINELPKSHCHRDEGMLLSGQVRGLIPHSSTPRHSAVIPCVPKETPGSLLLTGSDLKLNKPNSLAPASPEGK